jgi:hypothetical protein
MKITKTRLKEIIKEEVTKILEAGRPHSLRGGRTMKYLDDEARTRETDFLKKKNKKVSGVKVAEKVVNELELPPRPNRMSSGDRAEKAVKQMARKGTKLGKKGKNLINFILKNLPDEFYDINEDDIDAILELDETSALGGAPTGAVAGYSGTTTEEEKKKKLSHS